MTDTPIHEQCNPTEAKKFLSCIAPGTTKFTFQTFDDAVLVAADGTRRKRKRTSLVRLLHGTLDGLWDDLTHLNQDGAGIYVTVNETDLTGREARNVVAVRCCFLDLDGAPLEPVLGNTKPTVVVESSPGKFQVHYRVDDVGLAAFEKVQKSLARRFDGDDKVHDLPRVMRLPGFFHMKGEPFLIKITEHHPERQSKKADLLAGEEQQGGVDDQTTSASAADLNSAALAKLDLWVPKLFGTKARRTSAGGYRVHPEDLGRVNFEEELSLHPEGIKDFAVADQGDPRQGRRTAIDIVMEFGEMSYKEAVEWLRARIGFNGLKITDFYKFTPDNTFIWKVTGQVWAPSGVVDRFGKKGRDWIAKNQFLDAQAWAPGEPEVISDKVIAESGWVPALGARCYNLYRAPEIKEGDSARANPWIAHATRILLRDDARDFFDYCAFVVQNPGVKINHAKVFIGASGVGKDTLLEPLRWAVGAENWQEIEPADLLSNFNGFRKCCVLKVNELGNTQNRYQLYQRLKTVCAAPPSFARINQKHVGEYYVANIHATFMTMNPDEGSLYLPPDDRRMAIFDVQGTRSDFPEEYFEGLWNFYYDGGVWDVVDWLKKRNVRDFRPGAAPRATALWTKITNESKPWIVEAIRGVVEHLSMEGARPPALTVEIIAGQMDAASQNWMTDQKNRWTIARAMSSCGYERIDNPRAESGRWAVSGKRTAIYVDRVQENRLKAAEDFQWRQERRPGTAGLFPVRSAPTEAPGQ